MRKNSKLIPTIVLISFILILTVNCVLANENNTTETSDREGRDAIDGEVMEIFDKIATLLIWIAGAVCLGKAIHIGILYITGTANDKSNAKSAILPWIIGAIVCFAFQFIGNFVIDILDPEIPDVLEY